MTTYTRISYKVPGKYLTKIARYFLWLKNESQTPLCDFSLASFAGSFSSSQSGIQLPVLTEAFGVFSSVYVIRYTALN